MAEIEKSKRRRGRPVGTKRNGTIRFLSEEELDRFLKQASRSKRDSLMFSLIVCFGLKPTEISRLTLNDFDVTNSIVSIGETKYPVSAELCYKYKQYLKASEAHEGNKYLFVHRTDANRPITPIGVQERFKVIARKAGLASHSVNDLRHTCGLNLALRGVSAPEIAIRLRLRTTSLGERYLKLAQELVEWQQRAEKALENFFAGKVRYRTYFPNFTKGETNA